MSATMTAQLVADALLMAVWRRGKPDALMHHSDRGGQGGFKRSSQHNATRRHSTIGYLSPVEFERKVGLAVKVST
jgi:putative transposase